MTSLHAESPKVAGFERFFREEAPSAEGGAVLFSELGCANCHGSSAVVAPRRGPKLQDFSKRVNRTWAADFLQRSPGHGLKDGELDDVLAWISTVQGGYKPKRAAYVNAERGSAVYHEAGCVACHEPTPDFLPPGGHGGDVPKDWSGFVELPDFSEKTGLVELAHFLLSPTKYRTDGRMPHIELESPEDAIDLAAHLLDYQDSDPRRAPTVKPWPKAENAAIQRGKSLVEEKNCAACHDLPGLKAAPLKPLSAGVSGRCASLEFDLDQAQESSLAAFLAQPDPTDPTGKITLAALNCYACHDRDGVGGPGVATNPFFAGDEALGDSGRLPPPLTGIGRKLKRDWLETVFAGKKDEGRVRTYVKTQMPRYPGQAEMLAAFLEEIDLKDPGPKPAEVTDLEAGRKLLGTHGGVNCITCHQWDGRKSPGIQAMNIASLDQRLRPSWFREYLLNPASYRPGTLMPPLWPGGQSTVPDVLGGDTEKQIGAIWAFIKNGEGLPHGFPDLSSGEFELKPVDRAIIQRTFLEGVGTKAILVGFPEKIHLAWNADTCRPALLWRGRFFDAYNTWFTRAAPFESPLEEKVYPFPKVAGDAGKKPQFSGYELDAAGNPTFRWKLAGQEFSDRYEAKDGKLIRTWIGGGDSVPDLAAPEGVEAEMVKGEGKGVTVVYSWKK
ncbi:MAG: hypothetical protein HKN23_17095 [Verrucomicrobiales bacterium]|nr:hypothetical protein [Verrucomicrobiales bacterium]